METAREDTVPGVLCCVGEEDLQFVWVLEALSHQEVSAYWFLSKKRFDNSAIASTKDSNRLLVLPLKLLLCKIPLFSAIARNAFAQVLICCPLFIHVRIRHHQHILILMIIPEYLRVEQIDSDVVEVLNRQIVTADSGPELKRFGEAR